MKKSLFIFCILCSVSATAADKFLCGNEGVLFEPERSAEDYCHFRMNNIDECLNDFYQERDMYEGGKCLPITVKEYVRQSPKYKNGFCTIKISTVQVEGQEYMVRFEAPCLNNIPMGSFEEKFALMNEEQNEIQKIYNFLPSEFYPTK